MTNRRDGMALFLAIGYVAAVSLLASAALRSTHLLMKAEHRGEQCVEAMHLAEGGIAVAMTRLAEDPEFAGEANVVVAGGNYTTRIRRLDGGAYEIEAEAVSDAESVIAPEVFVKAVVEVVDGRAVVRAWRTGQTTAGDTQP
jgi:hypothetical protein